MVVQLTQELAAGLRGGSLPLLARCAVRDAVEDLTRELRVFLSDQIGCSDELLLLLIGESTGRA